MNPSVLYPTCLEINYGPTEPEHPQSSKEQDMDASSPRIIAREYLLQKSPYPQQLSISTSNPSRAANEDEAT